MFERLTIIYIPKNDKRTSRMFSDVKGFIMSLNVLKIEFKGGSFELIEYERIIFFQYKTEMGV